MNIEYKNIQEKDLENIARDFSNLINTFFEKNNRSCIVFLEGDLGAGKTTFTKNLGKVLNIKDNIISPTFVLRKDYEAENHNVIHVDGYRFEKEEEGKSLALDRELEQKGKVILIEWPERFVQAIDLKPDFEIIFKHKSETERDISINTY